MEIMVESKVAGVRLTEKERERIETLVSMGQYMNFGDFLRDAVRSKLGEFEFVFVRTVDNKTAEKEVFEFVKKHPDIYPDEIADKLRLDIETVMNAVDRLIKKGKIGVSK